MLGYEIKAKEIKRLPLAGKANSASLLLEPWRVERRAEVVVMEPPPPPGPSSSCQDPQAGAPSLCVALGTCSPSGPQFPSDRVGRGAKLERERQPGQHWVLGVWPLDRQTQQQLAARVRNANFRSLTRPTEAELQCGG